MALVALDWPARFGDVAGQLTRLDERLDQDTQRGDLVLLPELCLTGYVSPRGDFDVTPMAEDLDGPTSERLAVLARAHGIHLVAPLVERQGSTAHNTIVGFDPSGERRFVYRKRHPWYPETWATAGEDPAPLVALGGHLVTACICFDIHFVADEAAGALTAADLLLFPSAWVEDVDHREEQLLALARRFGVVVVNANWAPGDVCLAGQGRSLVVAPRGVVATSEGAGVARFDFPPPG